MVTIRHYTAEFGIFRWFYRQIHLLYSNEPLPSSSVFEYNPESSKLCLRETVSIHMYMSTAPCGDASAFPIESVLLLDLLFVLHFTKHILESCV